MLTLHDHRTGYTGVVYFLDGQRCFEETINKNDERRHAQSLSNLCWIHLRYRSPGTLNDLLAILSRRE
jgi:hypothetical protein